MPEEKDINDPGYQVLEKKVLEVEARISLMEKIAARIDGTLEQLEKRVSRIEEDIRRLDEKIDSLRTEVNGKIESLEAEVRENFRWTIAIMVGGFIATIATTIILKLLLG